MIFVFIKSSFVRKEISMKGRRWRSEEDQLLKETVLRTIQNGGTQLKAFAEVGKKLGRTPGACGFRWNAVLRKMDPVSYQEAKRKRVYRQLKKNKELQIDSIARVIQLLEKVDKERTRLKNRVEELNQNLHKRMAEYQRLVKENQELKQQQLSLQSYREEVKERYKELLRLFHIIQPQIKTAGNLKQLESSVDTKMDPTT